MPSSPEPEPSSPKPEKTQIFLGKFVSISGLLGAALFFAGWIYRWSYFAFFQLDVTNLNFPAQSFLIVSVQIFLGSFSIAVRSFLFVLLTVVAIYVTLWILHAFGAFLRRSIELFFRAIESSDTQPTRGLRQILQLMISSNALKKDSILFLSSLLDELVIIGGVLVILFWVSRWQGYNDAWRDAHQQTSTLPAISLITPLDSLPIGRQLEDVFVDPSLKGFGLIGDKGLFDVLRGKEDTDITDPGQPRVWRLLLNHGGWIYLYIALPPGATKDIRPSVIAVKEGGGQAMILSPVPSNP
ncbi:hypothetical protein Lepto7375DRAFT_1063 [Leptolyngbya sp. PCC 7375]|nr:hypothetical protein Lepto7375DRAFT_1063 [Leptolyngbya sp. PCC 7375]